MLLTQSRLRSLSSSERLAKRSTTASILHESTVSKEKYYDVFLSHSSMDSELILGAKALLESYGFSVYVDWVDDPQLSRSNVNANSAAVIRARMKSSTMLIYAHTIRSSNSKWCPWELGFFDGEKGGNVFILPISDSSQNKFEGQEYLGLYPYVDEELNKAGARHLWVNRGDESLTLETAKSRSIRPL